VQNPLIDFERNVQDLQGRIARLKGMDGTGEDIGQALADLEGETERLKEARYANLTTWERVQMARHPNRPHTLDYVERVFTDWVEIHGDRCFGDDPAIVTGFGRLNGRSVAIVGQQKGRDTRRRIHRNYGMPHPEGYRKALRIMKLAERQGLPVLSFVDTPGAYPGIGAEERGVAESIAVNVREMSVLRVPVIVTIIGEGGSGGALAIAVGDRILMLENAWYSVISPEGCASILWRSPTKAREAAEALKLTAPDLDKLGIIDEIIVEPKGGAHSDWDGVANTLRERLIANLDDLLKVPTDLRVEQRIDRFSAIGEWSEVEN